MALSKKRREQVFSMFGGKCAYCGCDLNPKTWHADHVEPCQRVTKLVKVDGKWKYIVTGEFWNPEANRDDNYFPACRACNINKSSAPLDVWRQCLERLPDGLRRDHAMFRHAERFGIVTVIKTQVVFYFETLTPEVTDAR